MVHISQGSQPTAGKRSKLKAYWLIIVPIISLLSACGGAGDPAMEQAAEVQQVAPPAAYAPNVEAAITAEAENAAASSDPTSTTPTGSSVTPEANAAPADTPAAAAGTPAATADTPAATADTAPANSPDTVDTSETPSPLNAGTISAGSGSPSGSSGAVILVPAQAHGSISAESAVGSSETGALSASEPGSQAPQ